MSQIGLSIIKSIALFVKFQIWFTVCQRGRLRRQKAANKEVRIVFPLNRCHLEHEFPLPLTATRHNFDD